MIDLNLVKQVTELADWFVGLPQKLVDAIMDTRHTFHTRRERIEAAKELAALREVGKSIQHLYFFKGNIFTWVNRIQTQQDATGADYVREMFACIVAQLDDVWQALQDTSISNLALGAEVSQMISKSKMTYTALAQLTDAQIFSDRGLVDIIADMEAMERSGNLILFRVDEHRRQLDGTY
jgi:hypothetical protein